MPGTYHNRKANIRLSVNMLGMGIGSRSEHNDEL
jgi:hypothetical protein